MADLLPFLPDTADAGGDEPRVVGMDSEAADDLIAALSSRTARRILTALHEEPVTPSALADRVDTSLQNVQYHLGRLEDAGAVEVADTAYSEKGREMRVYAPADRALIVVAGGEEERTGIRAAVARLLGALGALLLGSVLVQLLLDPPTLGLSANSDAPPASRPDGGGDASEGSGGGTSVDDGAGGAGGSGGGGGSDVSTSTDVESATPSGGATPEPTSTATPTHTATPTDTATPIPDLGAEPGLLEAAATLPPGALFFLGGATVLAVGFLWWYWRR